MVDANNKAKYSSTDVPNHSAVGDLQTGTLLFPSSTVQRVCALDFETFYDADYSIGTLGNWAYTNHPKFDPYLLSVAWDDGTTWQGNPRDFDWTQIHGQTVIAHNMHFEYAIMERLCEQGVLARHIRADKYYDTADLTAFLGYPRSLEAAARYLLGKKIDKGTRNRAKGRTWAQMTPEFQREMLAYAMQDAVLELEIWQKHGHKWPEEERQLSRLTRIMCHKGVPMDGPKITEAIEKMDGYLQDIRDRIPWGNDPETPTMSKKAVNEECARQNVPPPRSMAKDSEDFEQWLRDCGDQLPWARAIGEYRSTNLIYKKLIAFQTRTTGDEWMPYGLKYGGAHTLRDSGDSGCNLQNLHREPFQCKPTHGDPFDVDLRGMIAAPEGKLLGVVDLVAVEPCVLAVLARDGELIKRIKDGEDVYEAWARLTKDYDDPRPLSQVNPRMRRLCKVEQLGLSYGAGWAKCIKIAKQWAGIDLTEEQARRIVAEFKRRPFIPRYWQNIEAKMRRHGGGTFELELPSGRCMHYFNVKTSDGLSAEIPKLGQMMRCRYWGGSLTENAVQATARDVLMWHVLQAEKARFNILLRVHDELVCLLDEKSATKDIEELQQIMSTPPPWMPTLPIRASGHLCKHYSK